MAEETTQPSSAPPAAAAATPSAPSAPATPAPTSDHLSDLTSDYLPGKSEPASTLTPPSPEPAPTTPEAVTPTAAKPEPQKIKIRGEEYTLEEILGNKVLQQALLQTYEQFPILQKKYVDMLEQLRQQREQPQPQTPQIDPRVQQAQLEARYKQELDDIGQQGWFEQDFGQLYPKVGVQMLAHRDELYSLRREFDDFREQLKGSTQKAEATTNGANLNASLDALAGKHDVYKPLADPKERQGFLEFLVNEAGDPRMSKLTTDYLGRMWVAYKSETVLTAAQAAAERDRTQREDARRRAAGDGKGSRPTPTQPAEPQKLLDVLTEDFLPRR